MTDDETLVARLRAVHQEITEDDGGECDLMAMVREAADRIEELEREVRMWRECALYDATMNGPVFKGWDRSALDRARRVALEEPTNDRE